MTEIKEDTSLEDLVNAMNHVLKDIPVGPERERILKEMALKQLEQSTSKAQKAFWAAFAGVK